MTFIRPVAHPDKTSAILFPVEEIEIDRLVEVIFGSKWVGIVIFWLDVSDDSDHVDIL